MKTTVVRVLAIAAVTSAVTVSAVAGSCEKEKVQTSATTSKSEKGNIVSVASGAGQFNTLVAAVKAAGLADTLKGDGPFTVFAPTDEAFKKLPAGTVDDLLKPENRDKLVAILKYHVVPGKVTSSEVKTMNAMTASGKELSLKVKDDGSIHVASAQVIKADIEASNGVIHVIDSVVLPN